MKLFLKLMRQNLELNIYVFMLWIIPIILELDFIRAEVFVFAHVADEGLMNACAGNLLRYRKHIQTADSKPIAILADIKKKHRLLLFYSVYTIFRFL